MDRCENKRAGGSHRTSLGWSRNGRIKTGQAPHATEDGNDQDSRRNNAAQAFHPKGPTVERACFLRHARHVRGEDPR